MTWTVFSLKLCSEYPSSWKRITWNGLKIQSNALQFRTGGLDISIVLYDHFNLNEFLDIKIAFVSESGGMANYDITINGITFNVSKNLGKDLQFVGNP